MSRDKNYQKLLNSKRWKQLRMWKLAQNPLCEMCEAEGKVVAAIDVHHRDPVEECKSQAEMEARCFNPNNLVSLCIPCHIKVHQEARSHTMSSHQQRERERLERWIARHECPRNQDKSAEG